MVASVYPETDSNAQSCRFVVLLENTEQNGHLSLGFAVFYCKMKMVNCIHYSLKPEFFSNTAICYLQK